jgi:hypothetical protein
MVGFELSAVGHKAERQNPLCASEQAKADVAEVGICLTDIADFAGARGYAPLWITEWCLK